ncbi:Calcium/calmodulin-dependent 3',5'-cyclic nucleotide phosphodiesterase 1C, partial [Blomia tropicalis]
TKPELEEAAKHAIGGGGGGNGGGNQAGNTQHNQLEISGVSKVLSVSKESGQRPLSSFEQPSPGVDTLEVCDKAAARLRELSQHLEHGEIPSSLLQKTLQYVACVLDTVSMDETRRRKLNQQPQPPPRRFSQTPSSSTTMTIDTSTTSTSTTMITTMPSLTSIVANIDSNKINQQKPIVPRRRISIETVNSSEASNHNNIIIHNNNRAHANHNNKTSKAENGDQGEATTKVPLCNKTITTPSTTTEESVKRVVITQVDPKAGENIDETVKTDTQDQLQRRLLDEEDELAEVQPDVVPSEVREWLASTFTKGPAAPKTRSDEKPKFRSVANAIRAGIMVDRIYRRLFNTCNINIPNNVAFFLRAVDEWSFDVFALNELCINKVLYNLSAELLSRYGLVHKFKITTNSLDSFLNQIESGYMIHGNPYHNNLHAADVTQTVHYLLWVTGLAQWLTDLEVFATLIAAIIHDFKHTGTTNNFHIMSGSEISLLYNDRSVLENYHISEAFKVMHNDGANIAQNLSREEYREFRTLIIEMVIATDMSTHFQQIKTLKTLLSHQEFSVDKQKGLSYILHTADISHPSKVFNLHQRWTLKLMEEFFLQGDSERNLGLPYSPLCDRNSTLIPQSQIGFIDFIVSPTMELCGDLIDRVHEHLTNQQQQSLSPIPPEMEIAAQAKTQQRSKSSMERPEPSVPGNFGPARLTSNLNVSRNTSSAPVHSRSSAPVISFKKLNRPWLKQLEENKGMWQMKATEEAKLMAEMAEKEKNEEQEKE